MKNKTIVLLTACLVFGMVTVLVLYALSDNMLHRNNSFVRLFPSHPLEQFRSYDLKYNSYYIAGGTAHHVYLGNVTAPRHLLIVNTGLTDTVHVQLNIKDMDKLQFKSIKVAVDSPYFYIMDGIMPGLFKGNVSNWTAERYMPDSAYFNLSVPISPSSIALRVLSTQTRQYELAKESKTAPHFEMKTGLLQKQVDGMFCVDGMLHYNRELNQLVYVYFYRNQFICMDTTLALLYRGHTIDTVSHAKISVAKISSENATTMGSPPMTVNRRSCVYGNWLFVNSALPAKNENEENFKKASVIDVYNLTSGTYRYSFYLFDLDGKKLRDLRVFNNTVFALIDRHLVRQPINVQLLENL